MPCECARAPHKEKRWRGGLFVDRPHSRREEAGKTSGSEKERNSDAGRVRDRRGWYCYYSGGA